MKKRWFYLLIFVAAIVALTIYFYRLRTSPQEEILISAQVDSTNLEPEPILYFGIPLDPTLRIEENSVPRNANLSSILIKLGVTPLVIDSIVKKSEGIYNFRKMKGGNPYHALISNDSLNILHHFIYEIDKTDFVAISFRDSVRIRRDEREVITKIDEVAGTIKSSLWNAMVEINASPLLSNELSEIFAWSIDFFGLQQGDTFKVIYEQQFIDTTYIGIGDVLAAYMKHSGKDFYAIPFEQDSTLSFFDEEGNSLRKAFLKAPLNFSRISSRFSNSRMHPVLKIRRPHHGVDYAAPLGTPVHTVGDGKIIAKAWDKKGGGNYIKIKHNGTYTTGYLHLNGFAKGIKIGDYVKQGDLIGYVGKTGLATGPHLDFRFYRNGKPVDPLKVDAPPVEPILEKNKVAFDSVKTEYIDKLDKISIPHQELPQ